ncbi:hypothetical protein L1887_57758 [Cichorium endivia]|nr:hypothetical protein L1887_57758 [Cichorium endivia]
MDAAGKVVWARNSEVLSANVGTTRRRRRARRSASARVGARDGIHRGVSAAAPAQPQRPLCHRVRRRRVHHLHGARMAQQGFRLRSRLCLGERQQHVRRARGRRQAQGVPQLQGAPRSAHAGVQRRGGGGRCAARGARRRLCVLLRLGDGCAGAPRRRGGQGDPLVHHGRAGGHRVPGFVLRAALRPRRLCRLPRHGAEVEDEGVETAFEVVTEVSESVRTAKWTGECLLYTNSTNRLQYLVGEQTHTITHSDHEIFLLGYIPQHGRVYVVNKDLAIFSYALSLALVEYQTAILRGDLDAAAELLEQVPADQRNRVARFLETQELKELALEVSTDAEHRFDLAISLDDFETALEIARSGPQVGSESRWRTIGDKALARWNVALAKECFEKAQDVSSMLLVATSTNDRAMLARLAELATAKGSTNVAFAALLSLGDVDACIDVLQKAGRTSEAALFARTYAPSKAGAGGADVARRAQVGQPAQAERDCGEPGGPDARRGGLRGGLEAESGARGQAACADQGEWPGVGQLMRMAK